MRLKYFLKKYILTPLVRSIRMKLFVLTLTVAIVPLMVAAVISRQNSQDAMEQEILTQNESKMEWVNREFYGNVERIDESLTAFFFDNNVQFYTSKVDQNDSWQKEGIQFFRTKLKAYLFANFRDFITVRYYSFESNKVFSASYEQDFLINEISDDEFKTNQLFKNEGGLLYNIKEKEKGQVIEGPYLTKIYRRFDNQEVISALVVKLNWNLFERAAGLLNTEKNSREFFLDGEGKIIYETHKGLERDNSDEIYEYVKESDEGGYLIINDEYVFHRRLSEELYLVKTIPTSIATEFYRKTMSSQLVIILLTGIIIIGIILFFGAQLMKPIRSLTKSMQNIDDLLVSDALPETIAKTNDEIKVLEQSYRFMIDKIRNLIDKEYKQRIEIQSAQLMALQAQINPHFMYNTLQMIGAMAVEKEAMEIYEIIGAFSKMMRYNMQLTEELVTVEQELANVEQYLQIQKKRFDKKLIVYIHVPENTKQILMPKLSIQPIVENCFKYGFVRTEREWIIDVRIWQDTGDLYVSVKDNGQGITAGRLLEVQRNLIGDEEAPFYKNENLGLKNIDARIKMYFGRTYGLKVESEEGQYTTITMIMKATKKKEEA
ncbi:sensor histidine kinase [Vallitalea maricola]|uniref:Sensor histidine kinase n=1 Tax=Vallitalea maricola TaxID=3074433 RepID=A0ACB5UGG4_9FIRM|nr:sensor histidine kinase [Vallitalea sp. AN17-2]